jgi:alkylated DNA repair dioxygenase AlkB
MKPHPWTKLLLMFKELIEGAAESSFNSVLLNLYRSGADRVSWHQDNEPELSRHPVHCKSKFRRNTDIPDETPHPLRLSRVDIPLIDGSLLIMQGPTQECWQHRIPKTKEPTDQRITLTFRYILTDEEPKVRPRSYVAD